MGDKIVEYITRFILIILVIAAAYWLVNIIRDPILAQRKQEKRTEMVIKRLENGRKAQKSFKDKYGRYTASWDTLMNFIKKDTLLVIRTEGDPNVPDSLQENFERDTSFVRVKKSLFPNYPVDSIQYAPFTGKRFKMDAGEIKLRGVPVKVFEIKDVKAMNGKTLKVGSMEKGISSGNW